MSGPRAAAAARLTHPRALSLAQDALRTLATDLFWALEGVGAAGRVGAGTSPASPDERDQARLRAFVNSLLEGKR